MTKLVRNGSNVEMGKAVFDLLLLAFLMYFLRTSIKYKRNARRRKTA